MSEFESQAAAPEPEPAVPEPTPVPETAVPEPAAAPQTHTYAIFSALYAPHMGGVEAYTAGLASALRAEGHHVMVVTSRLSSDDSIFEEQPDGTEVYRLPCHALLGGRLPISMRNAECEELLANVAAAKPDRVVVNTRFYGHSQLGAQFAKDYNLPAIVIEHGSAHLSLGNPAIDAAIERYEHRVTERMKAFGYPFFAVSEKARAWLGHFGIQGAGIVANAIDGEAYAQSASTRDFRAELGLREDDVLVAFVGRLVFEKGIEATMEAARYLSEQQDAPHIVFAVAGDGPLLDEVEEATSNVVALGRLSSTDVAALLRDADAYVLPSRSEGFSTTLLEACVQGAYPIVTDVGGVDELGIGKFGGIVLPDASAASIVAALEIFCENRDVCRAQARVLADNALENNGWEASARQLDEAFVAGNLAGHGRTAAPSIDDAPFEGDERLDQLHRVLLMMMKDFAAICERENLTWFAHYGTAIGALRHGGFIPWDDDVDICMFRDDLERFEQVVQADTSGKYSIVNARTHPGYPLATTRFVLNGTEFRDSALASMDFPSGIFLDLFALDALADDELAFKRQVIGAWFFNKLATAKLTANPYIAAKGLQAKAMSAAAKTARVTLNLPGIRSLDPNALSYRFLVQHRGETARRAGYPCDTSPWADIYKMDDLLPARWVPFEDMEIPVPHNVERQLTDYYGDWMTPPPGNERKAHYPDILDFGPYADL